MVGFERIYFNIVRYNVNILQFDSIQNLNKNKKFIN